jgi:hypothetical protein
MRAAAEEVCGDTALGRRRTYSRFSLAAYGARDGDPLTFAGRVIAIASTGLVTATACTVFVVDGSPHVDVLWIEVNGECRRKSCGRRVELKNRDIFLTRRPRPQQTDLSAPYGSARVSSELAVLNAWTAGAVDGLLFGATAIKSILSARLLEIQNPLESPASGNTRSRKEGGLDVEL